MSFSCFFFFPSDLKPEKAAYGQVCKEDLAAILAITLPTCSLPPCHWPTCVRVHLVLPFLCVTLCPK